MSIAEGIFTFIVCAGIVLVAILTLFTSIFFGGFICLAVASIRHRRHFLTLINPWYNDTSLQDYFIDHLPNCYTVILMIIMIVSIIAWLVAIWLILPWLLAAISTAIAALLIFYLICTS